MSYYEILLFLHIAGAIVWLGSAFFIQVLSFRAKANGDFAVVQGVSADTKWLAQRIFIPTSLAMLVLGILLTIEGPWTFDTLWITLGLVGYAVTFLVGILLIEPEGKRLGAASAAHGPDHPEVRSRLRRIDALGTLDLALLVAIVFDMVVKPTADDFLPLAIMAVAVASAATYAFSVLRAAVPAADAATSPQAAT